MYIYSFLYFSRSPRSRSPSSDRTRHRDGQFSGGYGDGYGQYDQNYAAYYGDGSYGNYGQFPGFQQQPFMPMQYPQYNPFQWVLVLLVFFHHLNILLNTYLILYIYNMYFIPYNIIY